MTTTALTASWPWLLAGWTMLHYFWVGGLIGLLAVALRRALRTARPEVRYNVALLGLAALAGAPVLIASMLWPATSQHIPIELPLRSPVEFEVKATTDSNIFSRQSSLASGPFSDSQLGEPREFSPTRTTLGSSLLATAARGLPGLWLIGAPATFALLATGLIGAERLRRQSRLVTEGGGHGDLLARSRALAARLGVIRPVALGVCDRIMTPILLGILRPMILLPTSALTGWSSDQVEMALLHELAHVRRLDNLFNLVQRTIEAVLFFHPAVWWVSGWVRLEREHCCDEIVIAQTGQARPYAELLAALAVPGASSHGRAAVAMAEASIVARIRHILKLEDSPMRPSRAFVALVAGLLVAPAALVTSQAGPPDQKVVRAPEPAGSPAPTRPENARMVSLFREAKEETRTIEERATRVMHLIQIAEAQERTGALAPARQTLEEAATIAREIHFDELKSSPHPLFMVAKAQAEAGFRNEAIASLRTLLQLAEAPPKKEFNKGEVNFGESQKANLYRMIVSVQARLKDEEGVRLTLQKGQQFSTSKEFTAHEMSPTRLLVALQASSRDLVGALRMLDAPDRFQGRNAPIDRHHALLDLVSEIKAGDDEVAAQILKKARQSTEVNTDEIRKTWAGWMSYRNQNYDLSLIANAETRLGRFSEAAKTAQAIDPLRAKPVGNDKTSPMFSVSGTLEIKELGSPSSQVIRFPESATPELQALDREWNSKGFTIAMIGEAQAKAGDHAGARGLAEEVVHIAEQIHNPSLKQSLIRHAFQIHLLSLDFKGALRLSEGRFMDPNTEVQDQLLLANAQLQANDKAGAQATLDRALHRLKARLADLKKEASGESAQTHDRLLGEMGIIQARQEDLQGGLASIERISSRKLKSDALVLLARDRAVMNDPDGAVEVVSRIESAAERAETVGFVLSGIPRPDEEAASKPSKASPR